MTFDFDFSELDGIGASDPFAINTGGNGRPSPGCGLVQILGWSEYTGANGKAHELEFELIAWSVADDVGKTFTENIFHADNSGKGWPKKRMLCLAAVTGLLTPAAVQAAKAAGQAISLDMQQLVGRVMMTQLIEEPSQNDPAKSYLKVGGAGVAMYHVDDHRCAKWPKNEAVIAAKRDLIGTLPRPTAAAAPQSKPATTQAAKPNYEDEATTLPRTVRVIDLPF